MQEQTDSGFWDPIFAWFTDERLNWIGLAGIAIYLFCYYALFRKWCERGALWNRILRTIGLLLILTPLFMRWFLSQQLLIIAGISLMLVAWFMTHPSKQSNVGLLLLMAPVAMHQYISKEFFVICGLSIAVVGWAMVRNSRQG